MENNSNHSLKQEGKKERQTKLKKRFSPVNNRKIVKERIKMELDNEKNRNHGKRRARYF